MQPCVDAFVSGLLSPGRCSRYHALTILISSPIASLLSSLVGDRHVAHWRYTLETLLPCAKGRSLCFISMAPKPSGIREPSQWTK